MPNRVLLARNATLPSLHVQRSLRCAIRLRIKSIGVIFAPLFAIMDSSARLQTERRGAFLFSSTYRSSVRRFRQRDDILPRLWQNYTNQRYFTGGKSRYVCPGYSQTRLKLGGVANDKVGRNKTAVGKRGVGKRGRELHKNQKLRENNYMKVQLQSAHSLTTSSHKETCHERRLWGIPEHQPWLPQPMTTAVERRVMWLESGVHLHPSREHGRSKW